MRTIRLLVVVLMILRPPRSTRTDTLFPYTTLFRSGDRGADGVALVENQAETAIDFPPHLAPRRPGAAEDAGHEAQHLLAPAQHPVGDRKSTRLNSSH